MSLVLEVGYMYTTGALLHIRKKQKCVHIWTKNMRRFYHSSDVCISRVRRPNLHLSKSNFDRICNDVGITSS